MLIPIIFLIDGVDYVRKKSMHAMNTFILKNVLCVCIFYGGGFLSQVRV